MLHRIFFLTCSSQIIQKEFSCIPEGGLSLQGNGCSVAPGWGRGWIPILSQDPLPHCILNERACRRNAPFPCGWRSILQGPLSLYHAQVSRRRELCPASTPWPGHLAAAHLIGSVPYSLRGLLLCAEHLQQSQECPKAGVILLGSSRPA